MAKAQQSGRKPVYQRFSSARLRVTEPDLVRRRTANRDYLLKLQNRNLLLSYRFEAGLWSHAGKLEGIHWGWESPTSEVRGQFLGHWLSAAAFLYAAAGDREIKAKADTIVDALKECQAANGGEWVGPFPEKYLYRIAAGHRVWAPHYVLHKTFMGLLDMYQHAGNTVALDIARNWAQWFHRWTGQFSEEQMADILDHETGGMLEIWAELFGITQDPKHRELMDRYYRKRLFNPLLEGKDVLTNMHANTTVAEILGAARAYEVTGEDRWREIVQAYWRQAVSERGYYCTGGQTCGEIWSPKNELSARLGDKNQEHCTVYHMMRLAEFLFRWTGEVAYADYWERNFYNGILAQGHWAGTLTHGHSAEHPLTGLVSYFLPLRAGSRKGWASETEHFFCCHGTLVQANATHTQGIYYLCDEGVMISQYLGSAASFRFGQSEVEVVQEVDRRTGNIAKVNEVTARYARRPDHICPRISVTADQPVEMELRLRIPWWLKGEARVFVNGEPHLFQECAPRIIGLKRVWKQDTVEIILPKGLHVSPLPDNPEMVSFLDGPVVLAGLCGEDRVLYGDKDRPETMLIPDNEREWRDWNLGYRTWNQDPGFRFVPLYTVGYEKYTVYFQVRPRESN